MYTGDNLGILEKIGWSNNPYTEVVDGYIEHAKRIQTNTTREKLTKILVN